MGKKKISKIHPCRTSPWTLFLLRGFHWGGLHWIAVCHLRILVQPNDWYRGAILVLHEIAKLQNSDFPVIFHIFILRVVPSIVLAKLSWFLCFDLQHYGISNRVMNSIFFLKVRQLIFVTLTSQPLLGLCTGHVPAPSSPKFSCLWDLEFSWSWFLLWPGLEGRIETLSLSAPRRVNHSCHFIRGIALAGSCIIASCCLFVPQICKVSICKLQLVFGSLSAM